RNDDCRSSPAAAARTVKLKAKRRMTGATEGANLASPAWGSGPAAEGVRGAEETPRRRRRNASKIPHDVIAKVPCLAADLCAALGRYVSVDEVKECARLLEGSGEDCSRKELLEFCLKQLGEHSSSPPGSRKKKRCKRSPVSSPRILRSGNPPDSSRSRRRRSSVSPLAAATGTAEKTLRACSPLETVDRLHRSRAGTISHESGDYAAGNDEASPGPAVAGSNSASSHLA
ncbi:unnamed protein product, partial [Sphacelaria rigidula]